MCPPGTPRLPPFRENGRLMERPSKRLRLRDSREGILSQTGDITTQNASTHLTARHLIFARKCERHVDVLP